MKFQKPNIIIYRNRLLPISETFIYNQSILLENYQAYFLGTKYPKAKNIPLPRERIKLINNGGILGLGREFLFKIFGVTFPDIMNWATSLNPQLIHAHFGEDGAMIMPLVKKLNIPLIVSFLGSDATMKDEYSKKSFLRRRLYLRRRNQLKQCVTKIVVPSNFLREKVIEQGFPMEKIEIVYHGVDINQFRKSISSCEYGHILFVGRLIPLKGLNFLISAISKIKSDIRNIQLTVIGDGPMRSNYELQAKSELRDGYTFLGSQPNNVVREYLSRAYLFSMPSITIQTGQAESFGLVFIEAQAMGVPVVSFSSGGIPEVVLHGETGLLSPEGDIEDLSQNIKLLLLDKDLREKLSIQARENAINRFNLSKQNKKLESIYHRVLTEN